ncbi:tRNA dihydrouridine synthase [Mucor circinelloides]
MTCARSFINHARRYSTSTKLKGYEFYEKTLGSPKYIVGPMVEQSELAWRILCRRYNAQLCYTPMFHSKLFSDPIHGYKYQDDQWSTNAEDRPLIVQFCGNDPDTLLKAAKMVEHQCDAIDLNLGCPQYIAKKGRYGSFLQDDWDLIYKLISILDKHLQVPVTAKIRVFSSETKTVNYSKMLIEAGAQLLTVHGRLREQKGHHTGLADWSKIKAVKQQCPQIPVIANGNILYHDDVQHCLDMTGADGVMSAENNLYNPTLFTASDMPPFTFDIALEYLDICSTVALTRPVIIKAHLFKLFHASLPVHTDLRDRLAVCNSADEMYKITLELKDRIQREVDPAKDIVDVNPETGIKTYAAWRCQPYFRQKPVIDHQQVSNDKRREKAIEALKRKKALLLENKQTIHGH